MNTQITDNNFIPTISKTDLIAILNKYTNIISTEKSAIYVELKHKKFFNKLKSILEFYYLYYERHSDWELLIYYKDVLITDPRFSLISISYLLKEHYTGDTKLKTRSTDLIVDFDYSMYWNSFSLEANPSLSKPGIIKIQGGLLFGGASDFQLRTNYEVFLSLVLECKSNILFLEKIDDDQFRVWMREEEATEKKI